MNLTKEKISQTLRILQDVSGYRFYVHVYLGRKEYFKGVFLPRMSLISTLEIKRLETASLKKANVLLKEVNKSKDIVTIRGKYKPAIQKQYPEGALYDPDSGLLIAVHSDCPFVDEAIGYKTFRIIFERKFNAIRDTFPQETLTEIHSIKLSRQFAIAS